ncbi:uncharacterized protein LOC134230009 [Saccostrea cucullata]|uniref:uncharacterized protein LOC134230009 n=1 Tax=Saccostrea cuccullata TaxID=36930 RepID=UPI002ED14FBA
MDGSDIEDNRNCVSEEKANRCDVCSRQNLEAVGGFWCVDCSDMLCTKCRDIHKSIRSTMKHEVIAKSEISNLKMFRRNLYCEDHSDRKLEVYCFDHETPCCLMCATITHRKCDRVESLEECSKSVKTEDVDSLLNSFKILQKDCIAKEKLERTSHSELKSTCSQLANDIKVKAGKMIIHVQNKEQELLQDLSTVETYKSEEFEKKREMFQETRQAICKQIDSLTAVKSLSTVHMFLETNKCKKLYTSLKDGQAKWELPDEKCSVSLELDSFVVNFDAAFKTFGRCKLNKVNMREDNLEIISRISCQCDVRDLEIIDKSHIVFSSYSDCSVHLYNTDGLQKASLQLGGQLWAISRWGGKIAVVNIGDNSIEVLNVTLSPPSIALDSSIKLNYIPSGVAEKGEDLIVLCDTKMLQISKAGNISELFTTPSKCSYGFCCATRDALLYTDPNNSGQLYSVKNEGYFQNRFERTYPEVKNPVGVTTDSDGYMYLVGYSSSSLVQLDNDGTFLRTLIKNDCDVGNPYGVRIFEDLNSVKLLLATGQFINVYMFTRVEK